MNKDRLKERLVSDGWTLWACKRTWFGFVISVEGCYWCPSKQGFILRRPTFMPQRLWEISRIMASLWMNSFLSKSKDFIDRNLFYYHSWQGDIINLTSRTDLPHGLPDVGSLDYYQKIQLSVKNRSGLDLFSFVPNHLWKARIVMKWEAAFDWVWLQNFHRIGKKLKETSKCLAESGESQPCSGPGYMRKQVPNRLWI